MKKIILIPSYEPDDKLINLVKKLDKQSVDIIVVDDGSGKKYENIFNETKKYAHLISYSRNKGKGYALKKGIKYIKDKYKKDYIIITMDSDGQHRIEDALKLAKISEKNKTSLVLGKRLRNKKIPLRSKIGNSITKIVFELVAGFPIYDTQTGLRSFTDNLTDYMLEIDGNRFEYEMNVLLNLNNNNIDVIEETIETIYIENNKSSHFNTVKDSLKIYKEILKFSITSIKSFIIDFITYIILIILSGNILIANIISRILSSTYKYNGTKHINNSLKDYILIESLVLILNTLLLCLLVNNIGINIFIAKLLTELSIFIFNFIIISIISNKE